MKNLINFKKFNESVATNVEIDIKKREEDERAPIKRTKPKYDVIYTFYLDGEMLEFSGYLNPSGDTEYEFEPSWFSDQKAEEYYDSKFEDIEDEILDKLAELI